MLHPLAVALASPMSAAIMAAAPVPAGLRQVWAVTPRLAATTSLPSRSPVALPQALLALFHRLRPALPQVQAAHPRHPLRRLRPRFLALRPTVPPTFRATGL